jgi:hypothetical protein
MLHPRDDFRFLREPSAKIVVDVNRVVEPDDFQGDIAIYAQLMGAINYGHPAAPNGFNDHKVVNFLAD